MLKITKDEYVNEDRIECIAIYGSRPLKATARKAREGGHFRGFIRKTGFKTIILLDDGCVFLCPYMPNTYLQRGDRGKYILADKLRYILNRSKIREVSASLTTAQRKSLKEAKEGGMFVNLAGNRKATHYVFMVSGRIYGLHGFKELEKGRDGYE